MLPLRKPQQASRQGWSCRPVSAPRRLFTPRGVPYSCSRRAVCCVWRRALPARPALHQAAVAQQEAIKRRRELQEKVDSEVEAFARSDATDALRYAAPDEYYYTVA